MRMDVYDRLENWMHEMGLDEHLPCVFPPFIGDTEPVVSNRKCLFSEFSNILANPLCRRLGIELLSVQT